MQFCTKCKKKKYLKSFYCRKTGYRSGEYYVKCKECMKSRGRTYYHANRKRQLPLARARTIRNRRAKFDVIKKIKDRPCEDCNIKYPHYVMDFDHREDEEKKTDVSRAVAANWSLERIKVEVRKCDIICSNCHRERTFSNLPR